MTTVEILKEMAFTATETQRRALEDAISALSTESCDDCISRKDAIQELKAGGLEELFESLGVYPWNVIKMIPSVQPTVSVSENPNKWIPVSERLPDETKTKGHGLCHVLVTHTYAGIIRTHQAVFTQGKFLKLETYKEDNTVVAWMPLPEPYKESDTK